MNTRVPHRWELHKGSLHWCTQSVKACSVALSPLSRSTDPCQALTVRQAINSQTINHSSQGSQQHWARALAHNIRMCVCVYMCVVPLLEPHVPDPCEDYRAAFGRKRHPRPERPPWCPMGSAMMKNVNAVGYVYTAMGWPLLYALVCAHRMLPCQCRNKQSRQKQKRERGKAKPCN